jgi:oxygen-dependent protoporphyrinogen oxidase
LNLTYTTEYLILGAGLSGLSSAYRLQKEGKDLLIVDKNLQPGGVIRSVEKSGYLMDFGANSAAMTPELNEMIEDLDLQKDIQEPTAAAANRYIARDGKLHRVYPSPKFLLSTDLLSRSAKWRLASEPWRAKGNGASESVQDFFSRRLGKEAFEYLVDPVLGGIYAGVPARMHMASVMPRLVDWESEHGSLFKGMQAARKAGSSGGRRIFSFQQGMQQLPLRIADRLGENLLLDRTITKITKADSSFQVEIAYQGEQHSIQCQKLVWTLPANQYALLKYISPEATEALAKIPYVSMGMLFLGFDQSQIQHSMDGFGFLVPSKESKELAGAIWNSAIFPNRAPEGKALFTLFVGGGRNPFANQEEAETAAEAAKRQFKKLMGVSGDADFEHLYFWPQAIPQYEMEHPVILAELKATEAAVPGLHFVGNYRNGVSVGDCVKGIKLY